MRSFLNTKNLIFDKNVLNLNFLGSVEKFWFIFQRILKASNKIIPWRFIHNWECVNCGECCKRYNVSLSIDEWLKITKIYGVDVVTSNIGKVLLKRRSDGSCVFLYRIGDKWVCGLQSIKPKACRLWPFYIKEKPVYGYGDFAYYNYNGLNLYIYVDTFCRGLTYGLPSKKLLEKILPEVVEIYLGRRIVQQYTTSQLNLNYVKQSFLILPP